MLTAQDTKQKTRLALPDFRSRPELEAIRGRARDGELVCPVCQQPLWLRAGQINIPHFAHRSLNECPHASVSGPILRARSLLYRFFQDRIASGKMSATVELEPTIPNLPKRTHVDLLLNRRDLPSVAIVLLESGLKPEAREDLPRLLAQQQLVFRPVFMISRLNPHPDRPDVVSLDITQRDFRQQSLYGIEDRYQQRAMTLRFIDPDRQRWLSLRSLTCVESPQTFRADIRESAITDMLWSQPQTEWVHPGEHEALQILRKLQNASLDEWPSVTADSVAVGTGNPYVPVAAVSRPVPQPDSPPAWLRGGLVCVGCQTRTNNWSAAQPGRGICVCYACSNRGVRLP